MGCIKKTVRYIGCSIKILFYDLSGVKKYRYVMCKKCKGCIRLPKNKGTLIITCPKCGEISNVDT